MTEKIPSDYLLKEAPQQEVEKQLAVYQAFANRGMSHFKLAIPQLEARIKQLKTRALLTEQAPKETRWVTNGVEVICIDPSK